MVAESWQPFLIPDGGVLYVLAALRGRYLGLSGPRESSVPFGSLANALSYFSLLGCENGRDAPASLFFVLLNADMKALVFPLLSVFSFFPPKRKIDASRP